MQPTTMGETMDVIEFLERMGQDASLREASGPELETALADAAIDETVRAAILDQDGSQLQALLGKGPLFAVLMPDEDEEEEGDEDEDEEERPSEDRLHAQGADAAPAAIT